jgi:hypothetical protein
LRKKKQQPPSRMRWASLHRSIGVCVDLPTYDRLMAMRVQSGLSFGMLFKQAMGVIEKNIGLAWKLGEAAGFARGRKLGTAEGEEIGYAKAAKDYRLTFDCSICGEAIEVRFGEEAARAAVAALAGWRHTACDDQLPRMPRPIGPLSWEPE